MKPKVILSAGNIAHYHHTALALQKAGWLWKYFCVFHGENDLGWIETFLPADLRKRLSGKVLPGLDPRKLHTFPAPYLFTQALRRAGLTGQARTDALFSALYDRATQYQADEAEVFHFVNGMGLRTAQRAKERGCTVICDVRAEHVDVQERTLCLEYDRLGLPYRSLRALYRDRLVAEYDLADFLLVPSSYVAETFVRSGISPAKLFIVPYGVDFSVFAGSTARMEEDETKRPFRILYVGQVIPRKGIHYLVQAFSALKLPNSELVIIGQGEPAYQDFLKEKIGSECTIRFVSHLPQIELKGHYRSSDVFVLPTLSEGSSLVVYEAMSAGLPVITTPNAGSVIRNGQDGLIFATRDVNALQEKLIYLYEHPQDRRAMGEVAMCRVREFTWERYGERLIALYDRILTQKGR